MTLISSACLAVWIPQLDSETAIFSFIMAQFVVLFQQPVCFPNPFSSVTERKYFAMYLVIGKVDGRLDRQTPYSESIYFPPPTSLNSAVSICDPCHIYIA